MGQLASLPYGLEGLCLDIAQQTAFVGAHVLIFNTLDAVLVNLPNLEGSCCSLKALGHIYPWLCGCTLIVSWLLGAFCGLLALEWISAGLHIPHGEVGGISTHMC